MVAGGFVALLASLPIGWLCFRLRGPYFTIATIATAQVLMLIFLKFRDFAWGAEGTTIPNLGHAPLMMQFETKAPYYYIVLGLLAIALLITARIERSLDRLLLRRDRRGRGRCRGDRRQRTEGQARNLHDQCVPHCARRHVLHAIHIFHRSRDGVQLQHLDRGCAGLDRRRCRNAVGADDRYRPAGDDFGLLQSWLGSSIGGVQLTVYAVILMAVILWRPTGIMGYLAEVYARRRSKSLSLPAKA